MNFKNILLVTDADGTLLNDRKCILLKDRVALDEFTHGGGMFTIATGRSISLMEVIADQIELTLHRQSSLTAPQYMIMMQANYYGAVHCLKMLMIT
jgi:hydroxymethylpyrimidine pyrophosphatase-like HAD family hydrolase